MNVLSKVFVDVREQVVHVSVAILRILRIDRLAYSAKTLLPPWPLWPTLSSSPAQPTTTFKALEDKQQPRDKQDGGQSPREAEPASTRSLSPCRINENGVPTYEALHFHEFVKPTLIDEVKFPGIDVDDATPQEEAGVGAVFHAVEKAVTQTAGRAQASVVAIVAPLGGGSSVAQQEDEEHEIPTVEGYDEQADGSDEDRWVSSVGSKRKESDGPEWETTQLKRSKPMQTGNESPRGICDHEVLGNDDVAFASHTALEESSGLIPDRELFTSGGEEDEGGEAQSVVPGDPLQLEAPTAVASSDRASSSHDGDTDIGLIRASHEQRSENTTGLATATERREPIGAAVVENDERDKARRSDREVNRTETPLASVGETSHKRVPVDAHVAEAVAPSALHSCESPLGQSNGLAEAVAGDDDRTLQGESSMVSGADNVAATGSVVRDENAKPSASVVQCEEKAKDNIRRIKDTKLEESSGIAAAFAQEQSPTLSMKSKEETTSHTSATTAEDSSQLRDHAGGHEQAAISAEPETESAKSVRDDSGSSIEVEDGTVGTLRGAVRDEKVTDHGTEAQQERTASTEDIATIGRTFEGSSGLAAAFASRPLQRKHSGTATHHGTDSIPRGFDDTGAPEGLVASGDGIFTESRDRQKPSPPVDVVDVAKKRQPSLSNRIEVPKTHGLALTSPSASAFEMALRGPSEVFTTHHSALGGLLESAEGLTSIESEPAKASASTALRLRGESAQSNDTEDTESDRHLEEVTSSNDDNDDEENKTDESALTMRDNDGNVVGVIAHVIKVDEVVTEPDELVSPEERLEVGHETPAFSSEISSDSNDWSSDDERSGSEDPVFSAVPPSLQKRVISAVYYTI